MPIDDILKAIDAERSVLVEPILARLQILSEMERLARRLTSDATPPPAQTPTDPVPSPASPSPPSPPTPAPPRTSPSNGTLGARAQYVLKALRDGDDAWVDGWVAAPALALIVGMTGSALKKHLQLLGDRGFVETRGETSARRYRAVFSAAEYATRVAPLKPQPPDQPASMPESPPIEPSPAAPLESTPVKPAATPTQMRVARSRILDHLSRRRLNEQSLIDGLNLDRAVVTNVCSQLLAEGQIVRLSGGRYEHADGIA